MFLINIGIFSMRTTIETNAERINTQSATRTPKSFKGTGAIATPVFVVSTI
jgi:hypothetical protein